jgi:hypothetical protein
MHKLSGKTSVFHRVLLHLKTFILVKRNTSERNMFMTEKAVKVNYTEEMTERLHNLYAELGNDGLDKIAETMGKPVRSVRAKLVRDGVYVAPVKGVAPKKEGPSKKELLNELESIGFNPAGLEGATKEALMRVKVLMLATKAS